VTGPQPTPRPVTLASVHWNWGSAYAIGYQHDQWIAARRDANGTLVAATLTELEAAIQADYRTAPVSCVFDPPGTPNDDPPSDDESFLLTALREAFPSWAINYGTGRQPWTAQTRKTTISQPTAVLLCAALVLADRRARRTNGPGPGPGPGPGLPPGDT